jgi:uncharacterized protein
MYDADKPILVGLILLISAVVGLLAAGIIGGSAFPSDVIHLRSMEIGGTPVRVEVADTEVEHKQGLSNRQRMPENQGMLFIFDKPDTYSIWMKEMLFPLDIYWIDDSGVIVDMWEYAHPDSYPQIYEPRTAVRYIIEVTGGFSDIYNIELGDKVTGL